MAADSLTVNLESPPPASLPPGTRTALYVSGTASAAGRPARGLELLVNGAAQRLSGAAMARFDMPVRRSGFWGVIPVRAPASGEVELTVRAEGHEAVPLGRIPVASPAEPRPEPVAEPATGAGEEVIAICMATFDPDPELLSAQLESIRAQTDTRWSCVISDDRSSPERYVQLRSLVGDDERFTLSRSDRRIGFYRNFERALALAPPSARLVALCDQDDVWHPDKLSVLRAALGSAMLVYSDQRLVDRAGRVLRETMWQGRANNWTSLASLLIANTVTGAAALMRREVADRALPFPDSPGIEFHDHWIALVALACGELAYVKRPLYDYVQHDSAILGKVAGERGRSPASRLRPPRMREWRAAYFLGFVPGQVRARTLLLRCSDRITRDKRRALERYLTSDSSALSFVWFMLRPLRALAGRTETLAGEWELARGILWRWAAAVTAWRIWPEHVALDTQFPDPPRFEQKRLRRWRSRVFDVR
jgi:glycosyltransferase involved in cell wall biosynthesis